MERAICHDCGVKEGQIHNYGCDYERCPFCGGQLMGCSCSFIKLGFDYKPLEWNGVKCVQPHPTNGLPKEIYENGLTDILRKRWHKILNEKSRIPFIEYPNICGKCGVLRPKMFRVPDEEWKKYIAPKERDKIICRPCYDQIKKWIDINSGES